MDKSVKTNKKSMSTLEKPMNKCKCKISVPKCSHWHILAPKWMRQIARKCAPGSHFFVLWPKSCFQMMPLQAFLQHLQRLYIQFMLVYIYIYIIHVKMFVNPYLFIFIQPLPSPHIGSLNVFVDPYLYLFRSLRWILVWSLKMLCVFLFPVHWYQQCFAQARGCGQDLRAKLGGCDPYELGSSSRLGWIKWYHIRLLVDTIISNLPRFSQIFFGINDGYPDINDGLYPLVN